MLASPRGIDFSRELARLGWYHSMQFPDGEVITGFTPLPVLRDRYAELDLPADLHGKRTLDIGAWDGWFSFEMERHGADVTAVDVAEIPNFIYAHGRFKSKVKYIIADIVDLDPQELGQFDYVLFLGVLYHVRHPLLALERVCALTIEKAIVDSFVVDAREPGIARPSIPFAEFYEADELGGQIDNWWGPTTACLMAMCRAAGFVRPRHTSTRFEHARIICYRNWEPVLGSLRDGRGLVLRSTVHSRDYGVNFTSGRDEYVTAYFQTSGLLVKEEVMPAVGGFGTPPIILRSEGEDYWTAIFRLPPGLKPGRHHVRLRTAQVDWSDPTWIYLDCPVSPGRLEIVSALRSQECENSIILWVRGMAENSDRNNLTVLVNGAAACVDYVGPGVSSEVRQVNCSLPAGPEPATAVVQIRQSGVLSTEVQIQHYTAT
jgi:tRNA (mo5U34)-methyltransferase